MPYTNGTGISIAGVVINNTAPDQTVTLASGGGISISGTYPNFILTNSFTNGALNDLSNLNTTSVNQSLIPAISNSKDLGTSTLGWKDIFATGSFFLDGKNFLNNTGTKNTFIGNIPIGANSGSLNTAIGDSAGRSINGGTQNTFVGSKSGQLTSSGNGNTMVGTTSGLSNSTGFFNSFLGEGSGGNNSTGNNLTCLGFAADVTSSNLTNAIAVGANATVSLSNSLVLGNGVNVGIGTSSPSRKLHIVGTGTSGGISNSNSAMEIEGSGSTYINLMTPNASDNGILFGLASNSASGGIIYNGFAKKQMQFRTGGNITRMTIDSTGQVAIGTTAQTGCAGATLTLGAVTTGGCVTNGLKMINSTLGDSWNISISNAPSPDLDFNCSTGAHGFCSQVTGAFLNISDQRLKKDVTNIPSILEGVLQLRPVSFHYLYNKPNDEFSQGFIAQEVLKIFPGIVSTFYEKNGELRYALNYNNFGVYAIKAIQELNSIVVDKSQQINELKNENLQIKKDIISQQHQIEELKNQVQTIKSSMEQFDQSLSQCCMNYEQKQKGVNVLTNDIAKLEQNIPNPFNQETTIDYYLPIGSNATITIINLEGKQIISQPITKTGYGELHISGNTMSAGTYTYFLTVNGKAIESKIMVLTK